MTGFRKAKRRQVWLRMFTLGQSKNGKTYTSLALALHLADLMGLPPSAVGVIDSEVDEGDVEDQQGSAEKYESDSCQCAECMGRGIVFEDFETNLLPPGKREPTNYIRAIGDAKAAGIKVLVIDSLTHEWEACLEIVDRARGSKFNNGWGEVTPLHNRVISAIKSYPGHVIVTMRAKEKFSNGVDPQTGKKTVTSQGIQPVQRPMIEYEFDFGMFVQHGNGTMVGARSAALNGKHYEKPGRRLAEDLLSWSLQGDKALRERAEGDQRAAAAYAENMTPVDFRNQILALLPIVPQAVAVSAQGLLVKAGANRELLASLLTWVKGKADQAAEHGTAPPPQQQQPAPAPQQQQAHQGQVQPPQQTRGEAQQQSPLPAQAQQQLPPETQLPPMREDSPEHQSVDDFPPGFATGGIVPGFVPGMGQTYGAQGQGAAAPAPAPAPDYSDFDPPA